MTTLDYTPGTRAMIHYPDAATLSPEDHSATGATIITSLLFGESWEAGDIGTIAAWPQTLLDTLSPAEARRLEHAVNFVLDGVPVDDLGVGVIMAKAMLILQDAE